MTIRDIFPDSFPIYASKEDEVDTIKILANDMVSLTFTGKSYGYASKLPPGIAFLEDEVAL